MKRLTATLLLATTLLAVFVAGLRVFTATAGTALLRTTKRHD